MPINSSSIPALMKIARKAKKRRRAAGGGVFDWSGVGEAMPEHIGRDQVMDPLVQVPKSVLWDLPHKAIDAAKNTSYGLRREDFTDVPPDYSPDQSKAIYDMGLRLPKGGWQPTDNLIGASLEGATNVMGGTALSAPAKAAGEMVVGAGPRDPALWHGISKVKLPKPISEMSAVHVPTQQVNERITNPASMQGGSLLPLIGDRTGAGTRLQQVNGYKFDRPVEMQGGHGFMAANEGTGAAWASGKPIARGIANRVRAEAGDAPVYGVYTAMGERSGDFSHHVSDALAEMLPHAQITKAARRAFDDEMRVADPNWPGLKSEDLRRYLIEAPGGTRKAFTELMDTGQYQKLGFPSVAEARFATTDPRLLHAQTGDSGLSIARMDPEGKTFANPDQHLTYDTNVGGSYHGGLPASVPKEVMFPDIVKPLEQYRDALPGYKPTVDYLMSRTPKGLPVVQKADQQWVDGVSQYLEGRGFRLGAGANDKRAAAAAGAANIRDNPKFSIQQNSSGRGFKAMMGNREIGHVVFEPHPDGGFQAFGTYVRPDYRSRGVANAMYDYAEQVTGRKIMPSTAQTEDGFQLWKKRDPALLKSQRDMRMVRDDLIGEAVDTPHGPGKIQSVSSKGAIVALDGKTTTSYVPARVLEDVLERKGVTFGAGATDKRAAGVAALDDVDSILEAERRLAGASREPAQAAAPGPAAAADTPAMGPGGGGSSGAGGLPEAQATAARWAGERKPLEGLPGALKIGDQHFVPGPIGKIHDVAEDYMRTVHPDRPYTPPQKYHPIDPEHSKAIAQAYEEMKHTPNDPATKASYDALIDETAKQYQAIKKTGLKIEPIPAGAPDPYAANPRMAAIDVAENNHLWFFPTEGGFGTVNKITNNPMLRKTGEKIGDHELLANDMFRVVHDYFGHLKQGHGFRAAGEDNAWRGHSAMYSDLARPAMTTETRGQNSWVNYGPHGERNRTASGADTTYADQKVGLMPEWTMRDRGSPEPIIAYHGTPHSFDRFSSKHLGAGEGNQAYGHGLYFAGHSPVSEWYRHQLSARRDPLLKKYGLDSEDGANVGMQIAAHGGDVEKYKGALQQHLDTLKSAPEKSASYRNEVARTEGKIGFLNDAERNPGHLYEVAIDAKPEQFLDWDKRMNPDEMERFAAKFDSTDPTLRNMLEDWSYNNQQKGMPMPAGEDIVRQLRGVGENAKDFARRMKDAGLAGIRYLDQASRSGGKGTQNYVTFDDNMVRILRRYGIVGIPAAGVLGVDGEERRATGGAVSSAMDVARKIKRAKGGAVHVGPIVGDTGGRADKVPMSVPDGSYILRADFVSGLGEGNTDAGMSKLSQMFPESKPSRMRKLKGSPVPVLVSHGEFAVSPESIIQRWGDLDFGHKALDHWQTSERKKLIETLKGLPPPATD